MTKARDLASSVASLPGTNGVPFRSYAFIGGTNGSGIVTVTFPAGRFTTTPAGLATNYRTDVGDIRPQYIALSASACTVQNFGTYAAFSTVSLYLVQMTSGAVSG
jgi:hypothetical protein